MFRVKRIGNSLVVFSFIESGIRVEEQIAQEEEKPPEKLDLALKEGQTIKVNINMPKKDRRSKVRISIRGANTKVAINFCLATHL